MCMRAITIEDLLLEMEQTQQFQIFFTFHCVNEYMYHTRTFSSTHACMYEETHVLFVELNALCKQNENKNNNNNRKKLR